MARPALTRRAKSHGEVSLPPGPLKTAAADFIRPSLELGPGVSPGLDRRTADRLRRGRLPAEATLDLHGLSQSEAHMALTGFIQGSVVRGRRSLLIITGKGTRGEGVLRRMVPRWLNDPALRSYLLAIEAAQPGDGGAGALYVLLRRQRAVP